MLATVRRLMQDSSLRQQRLLAQFNRQGGLKPVLPALLLSFFFNVALTAQSARIERLDNSDALFRQYSADVAYARQLLARGQTAEDLAAFLVIYSYQPRPSDDLFAVAARCNLPYDSLASLNRLVNPQTFSSTSLVLLPTIPGLYIPKPADSDLEQLMAAAHGQSLTITVKTEFGDQAFGFVPGVDFSPTERAFFLNVAFRFPLPVVRVTSSFGPRVNPVTGQFGMHSGLDLAAAAGTEVYACRAGEVVEIGDDPVLGLYIRLRHDNGWESLYGHLSLILSDLKKTVRSGSIIAQVGSTGQSTGPHLHFELRRNGDARDPAPLLGGGLGR